MQIAISSLGQTWEIIPEVLGFLDPSRFDFYLNHPEKATIERMRRQYGIRGIDELWIVTTTDEKAIQAFEKNVQWLKTLPHPPLLRAWACEGIADLNTPQQCRSVRNLIYLIVLTAHRMVRTEVVGDVHISLAGGRKTISADLQDAAFYFGCSNLIHVIERTTPSNEPKPTKFDPGDLLSPPSQAQSQYIIPVRIAQYPYMDPSTLKREFSPFYLELPEPFQLKYVQMDSRLIDTIEQQTKQAIFFFENILTNSSTLLMDRRNFFYLFTLNPSIVQWMRSYRILGTEEPGTPIYRFLHSLPKAELHCHLGGVLDVPKTIQVASLLQKEVEKHANLTPSFKDFLETLKKSVHGKNIHTLQNQFEALRREQKERIAPFSLHVPAYIQTAAFVLAFQDDPELLDEVIYGKYLNPEQFAGIGIQAYERLGDLQGSALLQTEDTLRMAVSIAVQQAVQENARYLELRCSPWNYTKGELKDGLTVYRIIAEALKSSTKELTPTSAPIGNTPLRAGILLIASRHRKMSEVYKYIELMEEIYHTQTHSDILVGIDLAGDEKQSPPEQLRDAFLKIMENCPYITIHAGETEQARSVWGAVYHLNAERIGHGLTLKDDSELMRKVIDRGIALEMCPSSNHQIVGFISQQYPLRTYLEEGVRVTINTDNPGISRTNLTKEYMQAARLTAGGLTILEVFQLVKNGFSAAFLPLGERERLLLDVEQEIRTNSLPLLLEEVWRG